MAFQSADVGAKTILAPGNITENSKLQHVPFATTHTGTKKFKFTGALEAALIVDSDRTVLEIPSGAMGTLLFADKAAFYIISEGIDFSTPLKGLYVPVLTDGQRGSAGNVGRVIFNSTDGQLNIDDGTNWTLPDGTTT